MTSSTIAVAALGRPRVKPEHRPYRTTDGNVRIGSVVYGIGAEIEDPRGWVWSLIGAMDGSRGPAAVVAEVLARHPALVDRGDLDDEGVRQAMADLFAAGFLEDAAAEVPLPDRERVRYSRGVPLLRWMDRGPRRSPWDAQLRLREARVLLVGLGGTGGHAAQSLVASGVGRLHCVEPDVVELSNLNRQPLYRESDIGRPKVTAALAALRALNSDVTVTGERREVRGPEDLTELVGTARDAGAPYDLLVLAADHPVRIRRWANRVCLAAGLPWTDAGYRGPVATAGVYRPGSGACWECLREGEDARRDLRLPPGQDEEVASPRMPWNPATAVTAGLSGAHLAHAALALLTGIPDVEPGFRFGVNLMVPGDPILERFPRRPECPACGRQP
ncbi:HesA/MoeB/ThiF family protein [Streptomyces sp. NPDC058964]|uniref:HesA/MoeB/ThiF family protein n=1 Tax=Streptomyces sp. NPDC058964 TaxID=3346681 RepID=UPI0036741F9B